MGSGRKSSLRNGFQSNGRLQATREGFQLDAWPSWEHNGAAFRTTAGVSWSGGSQQPACSTTILGTIILFIQNFISPNLSTNLGSITQILVILQLSPELEKALLQQVMSLTPEQINMLPAEQRNQILQLQQILRHWICFQNQNMLQKRP